MTFIGFLQTPDGSVLDIMRNAADLLSHCEISIPKVLLGGVSFKMLVLSLKLLGWMLILIHIDVKQV